MTDLIHQAFVAATSSKSKSTSSTALCAISRSTAPTMAYYRRFPEAEVKEADYTAAADAAGLRPGGPASESDDTLGPNSKAWAALTNDISVLAKGYLKDISPEDARLLDGVSAFSLRGMVCEANFVFAGDSSMALVDMVEGNASTRRNIGEYIKQKPDLLPAGRQTVWHDLRWGTRTP